MTTHDAYANQKAALTAYAEAKENLARAKRDLERRLAHARYEGVIEGKNEGDRDAHARVLFDAQYDDIGRLEDECARAKLALDLATLDLEEATGVRPVAGAS